jgi:hypothetical protein
VGEKLRKNPGWFVFGGVVGERTAQNRFGEDAQWRPDAWARMTMAAAGAGAPRAVGVASVQRALATGPPRARSGSRRARAGWAAAGTKRSWAGRRRACALGRGAERGGGTRQAALGRGRASARLAGEAAGWKLGRDARAHEGGRALG